MTLFYFLCKLDLFMELCLSQFNFFESLFFLFFIVSILVFVTVRCLQVRQDKLMYEYNINACFVNFWG